MNFLIVEDKQEASYLLEVLLKGRGYNAIVAENGLDGLKVLEKEQIDVIISDILMPEMDGFKFCKSVKRVKELSVIPFIFYTATYVDKKDEEFALQLGADLFLRKPMEPELLMQEIDKIILQIDNKSYNAPAIALNDDKEIYKLYNQRLVKKLEKKIDQLENEITRRQSAEVKLHKIIAEKEILIKELYHRTKNNMQVISSMLSLYSKKILNDECGKVIKNVNLKIKTMALVHQELYESNDLSHVSLKTFLENLVVLLQQDYMSAGQTHVINTHLANIRVLLDTAIPLGFVANELITNSLKHAFITTDSKMNAAESSTANIVIDVNLYKGSEGSIIFEVHDNGCGLPSGFSDNMQEHLGLVLTQDIVFNQLHGDISYNSEKGLKWTVTLYREYYSERV